MAAQSNRCCRATGPQSRQVVSRKVASVASKAVATVAARLPATRRKVVKSRHIVATPASRTGVLMEDAEGVQKWNSAR